MTEEVNVSENVQVASVQFDKCGKAYHFDRSSFPNLRAGDYVIVETSRGRQMGQVLQITEVPSDGRHHKPILRMATPQDLVGYQHWLAKAEETLEMCKSKAADIGQQYEGVKFIQADYNFDGSQLTIYYHTEDKINISKLRAVLRRSLRTKVDFRQVGPRDVAKKLEGYGACGVVRCCVTFLTEFCPISIKMAKAQSISLNPSEITGICGRLRCCLSYEYEQYTEALKDLPRKGKWVDTPHGTGKVIDLLPMESAAVVLVDDDRHIVQAEDIGRMAEPPQQQPQAQAKDEQKETENDNQQDDNSQQQRSRQRRKKR
jgi:cell fate regulator YaaT (PSP1 superfamily)